MRYIAPGIGTSTSSTLLSWYLPSVIRMNDGTLPRRFNRVWIFIAPREYFPGAQLNSLRLREIVVESNANTSFWISMFGIGESVYMGPTRPIMYCPKSANILQSLPSFARERLDWLTYFRIPKWY